MSPEEMSGSFQQLIDGKFDLEAMQKHFEDLLRKQDEEHNFGHHFIGTQGDSQFGNMGQAKNTTIESVEKDNRW